MQEIHPWIYELEIRVKAGYNLLLPLNWLPSFVTRYILSTKLPNSQNSHNLNTNLSNRLYDKLAFL
jgi:hypothetical protein